MAPKATDARTLAFFRKVEYENSRKLQKSRDCGAGYYVSTICSDTLQRTSDRARRRGFTFTTAQRLLQHRNDPYGKHPVCLTVGDQTAIAAHY